MVSLVDHQILIMSASHNRVQMAYDQLRLAIMTSPPRATPKGRKLGHSQKHIQKTSKVKANIKGVEPIEKSMNIFYTHSISFCIHKNIKHFTGLQICKNKDDTRPRSSSLVFTEEITGFFIFPLGD